MVKKRKVSANWHKTISFFHSDILWYVYNDFLLPNWFLRRRVIVYMLFHEKLHLLRKLFQSTQQNNKLSQFSYRISAAHLRGNCLPPSFLTMRCCCNHCICLDAVKKTSSSWQKAWKILFDNWWWWHWRVSAFLNAHDSLPLCVSVETTR